MKLKYSIIEKLNNLTASEWKLLLYCIRYQEEATGCTVGVYYSNVMDETDICKQSFYNALTGLRDKGIIEVQKNSEVDYDITILGNSFPWKGDSKKTYEEGYVNISREAFFSKEFAELKPHEIYMLFELLKRTHESGHSFKQCVDNFYQEWARRMGVTVRVIRSYLHNLKKFFAVGIKDGKYFITYLHQKFYHHNRNNPYAKSEITYFYESLIRKECNRMHVAYNMQTLHDTAQLIPQYRLYVGGGVAAVSDMISSCICDTILGLPRKERNLQPKYVHKLLKKQLNVTI